jgi:hypothetical protein
MPRLPLPAPSASPGGSISRSTAPITLPSTPQAQHSSTADGASTGTSGVRAAIHRDLVKSGRIHAEWGRAFDRLFEGRQRADYLAFGEFEPPEAEKLIMDAEGFVGAMHTLVGR